MHYKDGREAKVGDFVRGKGWDGKPLVGQVTSLTPGAGSCNAQVSHIVTVPQATQSTVTVGEFELVHREDASAE